MILVKTVFCIGMLTLAGLFGVFLGWLEKKARQAETQRTQEIYRKLEKAYQNAENERRQHGL